MRGLLIAFEGLDQSGKQTQAELLRDRLVERGRLVRLLSFPAYDTSIGEEIARALHGQRDYGPDVMQLLYVANRYEWKPQIERELERGTVLVCDRYLASSIAYGEAFGLDGSWLREMQKFLPQPDLTFLLDIAPDVSARRKTADRDRYERDLALLGRVRTSYLGQVDLTWKRFDADRDRGVLSDEIFAAVATLL
ncbi:MAG TPA: dTMP kinase [Vicinamibacterales bacterium]|jgi:dTMP kinase|nr:dTMP kinase [Vicinamibacterales bacterium]